MNPLHVYVDNQNSDQWLNWISVLVASLSVCTVLILSILTEKTELLKIVIQKAENCNKIWNEDKGKYLFGEVRGNDQDMINMSNANTEIIITIQFIDLLLNEKLLFKFIKPKAFISQKTLLLTFWIHLDTSLRDSYKNIHKYLQGGKGAQSEAQKRVEDALSFLFDRKVEELGISETYLNQIKDTINTFKHFFDKY